MKVKELKELLSKYEDDMEVLMYNDYYPENWLSYFKLCEKVMYTEKPKTSPFDTEEIFESREQLKIISQNVPEYIYDEKYIVDVLTIDFS